MDDPELTRKQITNWLGLSDSAIRRYRNDTSRNSPHIRKNPQKLTVNLSRNKCGKCDKENITFWGKKLFDENFIKKNQEYWINSKKQGGRLVHIFRPTTIILLIFGKRVKTKQLFWY